MNGRGFIGHQLAILCAKAHGRWLCSHPGLDKCPEDEASLHSYIRYIYGLKGLPAAECSPLQTVLELEIARAGGFQEALRGFQEDAQLSNENFIPKICVTI